ncbi:MAG TPA: competence protein CoiA family protein [Phototrophicaceae bacterium]|nr:competence protein CoiA family protein [Phototrophicaceae bacterium]
MPLRAFVGGVELLAPELSEAEWEALREAGTPVILPCCGAEGYLRRSPLGTLHFAHKRGAHCDVGGGETIHHLKAKADIVIACQQAGYKATTEVAGDDWRADVLASRGSVRIAFEVQWSFLRLERAIYRQERYARDGVRGCWFFRNPPPQLIRGDDLKADQDLPLFHLFSNADHSFSVAVNGQLYGIGAVVTALLGGQIHFCKTARAGRDQRLRLTPFEIDCPFCTRPTRIFYVDPHRVAHCGRQFKQRESPYAFALRPDVLKAVLLLFAGDSRLGLVNDEGFHCVSCGRLIDAQAVEMALYGTNRLANTESLELDVHLSEPIISGAPHWCFPADGDFCC